MLVWLCPQDPYYTGALHAFLPNLDDIPIKKRTTHKRTTTKRKTKRTTNKRTTKQDDKRLKIASLFLKQFKLEDTNTTHLVFQALAQFFDVDVGPSTSTISTRTLALDTLTIAMADALENLTPHPVLAEIMNQANDIDKMASLSSTPKNVKTAKEKIPKKVKETISKEVVIVEIDDTELLPNEHKGIKAKR